ncbi:MAG TPA: efflux RND transporter periplasmic adaptor subunit [Hyphomicrobiales bacterium]|nr:efflux RND transporter periplasmic adaptor subunit [Hyphomicrobiales bacterium]
MHSSVIRALCAVLLCGLGANLFAQTAPLTVEQVLADDAADFPAANPGQSVRAQLVAVNRTTLSAGISAQISRVPFVQGESVRKGDLLLAFDCASLQAQQKIYEAQRHTGQINLEVKQRLLQFNNVSPQELDLAAAQLASAEAQLEVIGVELAQCEIRAPYDAILVARQAEPHQYVSEGTPVLELNSNAELEVLVVAPSAWLRWLQAGEAFTLDVEELGQRFAGTVQRLGGRVDPVSQTILVYGRLSDTSDRLLPGMSGDIHFQGSR